MKLLELIFGSTFGPPKSIPSKFIPVSSDLFDTDDMDMADIRDRSFHLIYKDNPIETARLVQLFLTNLN